MIDRQMLKGVVEMALMSDRFPDLQERTVYAVLRRLHENGDTETFTKGISGGPTRKYYRITRKGREHLQEMIRNWRELERMIQQLGI